MNDRDDLEAALRANGSASVPPIDASFADALEQRLLAQAATPNDVSPIARRARRISAATAVVTTLTFVGAAAAAGIVTSQHADRPTLPATTTAPPTVPVTTTTATSLVESTVPATTIPATAPTDTAPPTTAESTVPTTAPVAEPSTVATTVSPDTTVAPTEPPTTLEAPAPPPPTTGAPATTEVRTPATLTISCAPSGGTVTCTWTPGPDGTAQYLVLRSIPGSTSPGRAFFVDQGTLTWTDPMATTGTTYAYLVHARDVAGTSLGHSDLVQVGCC